MPVDSTFAPSTHEPEATYTGCICPNVKGTYGTHEVGCPTQAHKKPEKPNPLASAREWKQYYRSQRNG